MNQGMSIQGRQHPGASAQHVCLPASRRHVALWQRWEAAPRRCRCTLGGCGAAAQHSRAAALRAAPALALHPGAATLPVDQPASGGHAVPWQRWGTALLCSRWGWAVALGGGAAARRTAPAWALHPGAAALPVGWPSGWHAMLLQRWRAAVWCTRQGGEARRGCGAAARRVEPALTLHWHPGTAAQPVDLSASWTHVAQLQHWVAAVLCTLGGAVLQRGAEQCWCSWLCQPRCCIQEQQPGLLA
jgi:hypothetical protein